MINSKGPNNDVSSPKYKLKIPNTYLPTDRFSVKGTPTENHL